MEAVIMKEETFPLRLICIEETIASEGAICYCVCTDWRFHIISHTWTKDVRDWSMHIASFMHNSSPAHKKMKPSELQHDTYAELFKQHSFANKKGYGELLEFLHILAADGVERVWFDALCINQADAEEKDREISHMGAYYARSAGCYVWCHGVGGGFRLWATALPPDFYKLPRWFSRVWTLQEFLLPTKLAFIVGMDMEGFTGYYAYKAFCCSTRKAWYPEDLMDSSAKAKFGPKFEYSLHLLNSKKHFPCPHCGHHNISDREEDKVGDSSQVPIIRTGYSSHVYYVERFKYMELMRTSRYKSIANRRIPSVFEGKVRSQLQRLPSMLDETYEIHDNSGHDAVFQRTPECTEEMRYAEDRDKGVQENRDDGDGDSLEIVQEHGEDDEKMQAGHDDNKEREGLQAKDCQDDDDDNLKQMPDGINYIDNGDNFESSHRKDGRQKHYLQLAALAIREISERFCSEGHDEDRLLSILGLLEVEGKVQLRTGKSLEEQTIEIAQGLLNYRVHACKPAAAGISKDRNDPQNLLAFLCLAQFKGNPTVSMSWAPTFSFQNVMGSLILEKISGDMFNSFKRIASIEGVSKLGLKLHCPFMQARIIPFAHHKRACGMCNICVEYTRMILNPMEHFILEVDERKHYSVYMWVRYDIIDEDVTEVRFMTACPPTCSMAIKAETSIERLITMSLDVWLLLVAQDKLEESSQPYGLFLVCVGQDMENLHKVGVFFNGPGWDPEKDDADSDAASNISASSEAEELIENEEEDLQGCSNQEELETWREELAKESAIEEEEEEEEEEEAEESDVEKAVDGQEEEAEEDLLTWEQDLECMQWGNFTVGGFGQFLPLNLFTFHD